MVIVTFSIKLVQYRITCRRNFIFALTQTALGLRMLIRAEG